MTDNLFPAKLTRREMIAAGLIAATTGTAARAADAAKPVTIGAGKWTFTLDADWGKLPAGMTFGHGCGIVVDSKDRIYVTSRSASPCVAVFDKAGKLLETWAKDFGEKVGYADPGKVAATAHGLYWSQEPAGEFLYFTENVAGGKDAKIGARVYKTDLTGKVLYTIGNVPAETDTAKKFVWTNPTDVAVAPNGDIYVVDGYGSQKLTRFDKDFKEIKTIGGSGTEHGKFKTCHGVWVSTLGKEPEVYVADRGNGRYEVFSLDLEYKRTVSGAFARNPCCFYQHDGHLYVPDLASLVSVIDAKDQPVATLGDGKAKGVAPDAAFQAPHALTVDSEGSLYVVEWVPTGRVRKFKRTPA